MPLSSLSSIVGVISLEHGFFGDQGIHYAGIGIH